MPFDNNSAPGLEARLRREIRGEVLFDRFTRGRYATDASIYQIEPLGVVVPEGTRTTSRRRSRSRARKACRCCRAAAGTSQCGQTVGRALVLDCSKHMRPRSSRSMSRRGASGSSPGSCSTGSTRALQPHRLFFPVDPSTGEPRHDRRHDRQQLLRLALDALRQHGAQRARRSTRCSPTAPRRGSARSPAISGEDDDAMPERYRDLVRRMRALHRREADEIERRFPQVLRRVGGYNIDIDRRRRPQHGAACWSAPRARSPSSPRSSSTCSRSRRTGCSASAISRPSTARWRRPSTSSSWARRGRAGRPHDDRAGARHPDVPRHGRPLRAGRARRRCC